MTITISILLCILWCRFAHILCGIGVTFHSTTMLTSTVQRCSDFNLMRIACLLIMYNMMTAVKQTNGSPRTIPKYIYIYVCMCDGIVISNCVIKQKLMCSHEFNYAWHNEIGHHSAFFVFDGMRARARERVALIPVPFYWNFVSLICPIVFKQQQSRLQFSCVVK